MRERLVVCALVSAVLGCSTGMLNPGGSAGTSGTGEAGTTGAAGASAAAGTTGTAATMGTAGTAGAGGDAGTGGVAGQGGSAIGGVGGPGGSSGTGGSIPRLCTAADYGPDHVQIAIAGSDGMLVDTTVNASVTVASIDSCASVTCPTYAPRPPFPGISATATRFVLSGASAAQWTLYLQNTAMPADRIQVGDTFDLTIDARVSTVTGSGGSTGQGGSPFVNQTVMLARNGSLMVFAAEDLALPHLETYGLTIEDDDMYCDSTELFGCIDNPHAMRVATGQDAPVMLEVGRTASVGDLSVTNADFTFTRTWEMGNCPNPVPRRVLMAGFRLP